MMNAEEQEYMDYLIHNRKQLTNQITRHLDEIERLENLLEVSEKAHYKTLQQLAIATKALREYADEGNWGDCSSYNYSIDDMDLVEKAQFGEKGFEPAQKALKEIDLLGTKVKEEGC